LLHVLEERRLTVVKEKDQRFHEKGEWNATISREKSKYEQVLESHAAESTELNA